MIKKLLFSAAMLLAAACLYGKDYSVSSPDGNLNLTISTGKTTTWSLEVGGKKVMEGGRIAMKLLDGRVLGDNVKVRKARNDSATESIESPLYRQRSFTARYNSLTLSIKGDYAIEARAYDDGVAYRIVTDFKKPFAVRDETVEYSFNGNFDMFVPFVEMRSDRYESSFESCYTRLRIGDRSGDMGTAGTFTPEPGNLVFTPVYVSLGEAGRLLIMESDVEDYPGLFLVRTKTGFKGEFPPLPRTYAPNSRGVQRQTGVYDYIAEASGRRCFPWRAVGYGKEDKDLPTNNMVYQLAAPNRIGDVSWITPGLSTWDWWNAFRFHGVDFEGGINTASYKYDVDFAVRYGLQYIILDEGWYNTRTLDVMNPIPDVDLPEICRYAASKGIKVILWISSGLLDGQLEKICSHYSRMGVAGFKVDFFDAQDQATVAQAYRIAETAARYHLILDYHGFYKPTGLSRTYPNVVNYEGVFGLEQLKWMQDLSADMPRNDVIIPFIRQAAGQLDYTQGALRNATKSAFRAVNDRPMSQGTRAHQVALYMVFDSPFAMLCDSPSDYLREPETTGYIASIPTVFEHSRVLQGRIGEYIVTAREKGGRWYVGGITDWTARDLTLDLGFLPRGRSYTAKVFCDGMNAAYVATDYKLEKQTVTSADKMEFKLAPGGGFAVIFE